MTPVQIPFKRNFKDMENKFEYLKIDGREQLPAPWSDYPVLREYETVTVYRNGRDYLDALVGQQDGWWVAGVHMEVGAAMLTCRTSVRCRFPSSLTRRPVRLVPSAASG